MRSMCVIVACCVSILVVGSTWVHARDSLSPVTQCTQPWSAQWVSNSGATSLKPSERATFFFQYRNVGCNTWDITQPGSQALLGTWNPDPGQDKLSQLGGAVGCGVQTGWLSCNRIRPASNTVPSGFVADFVFDLVAPPAPGTYSLHVRPLIEDVMWMEDFGAHLTVTVLSTAGPSRYMSTTDARIPNVPTPGSPAGALYIEGCRAGGDVSARYGGPFTPQVGVAILFFGRPHVNLGTQGTWLFSDRFASVSEILEAGKAWARGYWDCSPAGPVIRVVLGTSNFGSLVTSAHGRTWAQLVVDLDSFIVAQGWGSQVGARGGNDIETAWGGVASQPNTRNWACTLVNGACADGYSSLPQWIGYYDFGDAGGCPTTGPGACDNGWTTEDKWYVSWGAPAGFPLPQIYLTDGRQADQWYQIARYSMDAHGTRMGMRGTVTQAQACLDSPPCSGDDNSPAAGWLQLWRRIQDDAVTRVADLIRYATDFTWSN